MIPELVVVVVIRVRRRRKYGKTVQYYVFLWGMLTLMKSSRWIVQIQSTKARVLMDIRISFIC